MKKIYMLLLIFFVLSNHTWAMKRDRKSENNIFSFHITLETDDEDIIQNCSKFNLSKISGFFRAHFKKMDFDVANLNVKKIIRDENGFEEVNIPEAEKKYYIKALDWIHEIYADETLSPKDIFILFRICKNEWQCSEQFLDNSFKGKIKLDSGEDVEKMQVLFDPPSDITNTSQESYEKIILPSLINKVQSDYKDIGDICTKEKKFKALPYLAMKSIFTNKLFKSDSTDSIFSAIVMWHKNNNQLDKLDLSLHFFDVRKFSPLFVVNIVNNLINDCRGLWKDDPSKVVKLNNLHAFYRLALLAKMAHDGANIFDEKHPNSIEANMLREQLKYTLNPPVYDDLYVKANEKFAMKVEFRKVSKWKLNEKYYSQPIFSNGYYFFYFMRIEKDEKDKNQPSYLAGYVRCMSEGCITPTHYLPAKITIEILLPNNLKRKLPPIEILFDHFDKSIGHKLSKPDKNWELVRNKQKTSDIVIDNTITVITEIEFISPSKNKS